MSVGSITLTHRRRVTTHYMAYVLPPMKFPHDRWHLLIASDRAQPLDVAPMSSGVAEVALHIFCNVATLSLLSAGSAGPLPSG